jgi:hypothetical protein
VRIEFKRKIQYTFLVMIRLLLLFAMWIPGPLAAESSSLSPTSQSWNEGVEDLIPQSAFRNPRSEASGPRTLLSTGVSVGSDGESIYQQTVGYRATENLTLLAGLQGGRLVAPFATGGSASMALPPMSNIGAVWSGLNLGGWQSQLNFSFSPGAAFQSTAMTPNAEFQQALNPNYSVGGSFSKVWGDHFSTTFAFQMNQNPFFSNTMFYPAHSRLWP